MSDPETIIYNKKTCFDFDPDEFKPYLTYDIPNIKKKSKGLYFSDPGEKVINPVALMVWHDLEPWGYNPQIHGNRSLFFNKLEKMVFVNPVTKPLLTADQLLRRQELQQRAANPTPSPTHYLASSAEMFTLDPKNLPPKVTIIYPQLGRNAQETLARKEDTLTDVRISLTKKALDFKRKCSMDYALIPEWIFELPEIHPGPKIKWVTNQARLEKLYSAAILKIIKGQNHKEAALLVFSLKNNTLFRRDLAGREIPPKLFPYAPIYPPQFAKPILKNVVEGLGYKSALGWRFNEYTRKIEEWWNVHSPREKN